MQEPAAPAFDIVFALKIAQEGGYSNDPSDPGNWTGGAVGRGQCKGTKWGVSAAAYPTLPIETLTEPAAKTLYLARYWMPICGDRLALPMAALLFDAAVNNGVRQAIRWLQGALSLEQDGVIGPATLMALGHAEAAGLLPILTEFQARRFDAMASLPGWPRFGLGWSRRLCALFAHAIALTPSDHGA